MIELLLRTASESRDDVIDGGADTDTLDYSALTSGITLASIQVHLVM